MTRSLKARVAGLERARPLIKVLQDWHQTRKLATISLLAPSDPPPSLLESWAPCLELSAPSRPDGVVG